MQESNNSISIKQLAAMIFVSSGSPAIRILPKLSVEMGGKAVWLSPIVAIIPVLIYLWFLRVFLKNRKEGEGLTDLFIRSIGKWPGRIIAILYAVWLVFYTGFILRTAGERLLSSVYTSGSPVILLVLTMVVSMIAALGKMSGIARSAQVIVPILSVTLIVVMFFSIFDIKTENLLPVSYLDADNILLGALPVFDVVSICGYFTFLVGHSKKTDKDNKSAVLIIISIIIFIFFIMVTTIGSLSEETILKLQSPFFILIREIKISGIIERVEAVVIIFWAVTDYVFLASLMIISSEIMKVSTQAKSRKPFVWFIGAAALAIGFLISKNDFDINILSEKIVPIVTACLEIVILPIICIIGKLRKKI